MKLLLVAKRTGNMKDIEFKKEMFSYIKFRSVHEFIDLDTGKQWNFSRYF